jgi:predicted acyl esterase
MEFKSEVRDGMRIDWDVPVTMDDGLVLRADIFRPVAEGRYPAIMTYGPYGKGVNFAEGYKTAWDIMCRENPDAVSGTTNKYQNWEVVDPEKWVPDGYVASIHAVRAVRLAICATTTTASRRTITIALNGPQCRHGPPARSA